MPAGITLKAVPGQVKSGTGWHWDGRAVVIDADKVTLQGLDINGPVSNNHSGLTVKNTRIRCTGENDWCISLSDHAILTDSEIGGGADGKTFLHAIAIWSGDSNSANLIQRVNIHHTIHGLRVDGGTTMVDSYIHDLPMGDPVLNLSTGQTNTNDHTDGLMTTGGGNTVIRHNRIEGGNTANLFVQWDGSNAKIGSYLVENNYFVNIHRNGQDSSWGVAIENKGIQGPITVRNNTFNKSTWTVGPIEVPPGATKSGDIYTDGTSAD